MPSDFPTFEDLCSTADDEHFSKTSRLHSRTTYYVHFSHHHDPPLHNDTASRRHWYRWSDDTIEYRDTGNYLQSNVRYIIFLYETTCNLQSVRFQLRLHDANGLADVWSRFQFTRAFFKRNLSLHKRAPKARGSRRGVRSGERRKLPQRGPGRSPGPQTNLLNSIGPQVASDWQINVILFP